MSEAGSTAHLLTYPEGTGGGAVVTPGEYLNPHIDELGHNTDTFPTPSTLPSTRSYTYIDGHWLKQGLKIITMFSNSDVYHSNLTKPSKGVQ